MKQKVFNVIKPTNLKPRPDEVEDAVAELMANYFLSDVVFVPRLNSRTPDITVTRLGQRWEIKSPRGNSKNTMHNALKSIDQQSENVIIALLRSDMPAQNAKGRIYGYLGRATRIKRMLLITKNKKIIVIK